MKYKIFYVIVLSCIAFHSLAEAYLVPTSFEDLVKESNSIVRATAIKLLLTEDGGLAVLKTKSILKGEYDKSTIEIRWSNEVHDQMINRLAYDYILFLHKKPDGSYSAAHYGRSYWPISIYRSNNCLDYLEIIEYRYPISMVIFPDKMITPEIEICIMQRPEGPRNKIAGIYLEKIQNYIIALEEASKDINHTQDLKDLHADKEELKKELLDSSEGSEKVDILMDDYQTKVGTTFDTLAEESTGREAEFYRTMAAILREMETLEDKWENSLDAVQAPEVLVFSLLKFQDEINVQKEIVAVYIAESENYKEYYLGLMDHMKKMLEPVGLETDLCKGALEGAQEKYNAQKPIMIPLMNAHIAYGKAMMEILILLEEDPNGWSFEDGELNFSSEENQQRFDDIILKMLDLEEKIDSLSDKLVMKVTTSADNFC